LTWQFSIAWPFLREHEMKRHDFQEVSTLLRLADDMIKSGKSQKDACKSLGISVMTFHRWRKLAASADAFPQVSHNASEKAAATNGFAHSSQVDDLKLENQRLRRIVSDLLLEKMKVQEALDKAKR
jgi:hypothetical protein